MSAQLINVNIMIAPFLEVAASVVFPGRLVCPWAGAEDADSVDDQPWKWKGLFEKDQGPHADVQSHTTDKPAGTCQGRS